MEDSCKVCRKWQRHFYWNHTDPKNVKFFVQMETSFTNHLDLPRNFAKRFKGKILEIVKLKGPSGRTWPIEVLKSENKLSLKSGWTNFVTANKIDENDLLVFKYSGNSSFDVVIFDRSGCEKVVSFTTKKDETGTEAESELEAEKTSSESDTSVRVFIPPNRIASDIEISSSATGEQRMRGRNGSEASRRNIKNAKQAPSERPYHMPWKLKLSAAERKIADEMAIATQPGSKLFLKILTPSDAQSLTVPTCFANENIVKGTQPINLLLANKEKVFRARYCCHSLGRHWIRNGWREFAREYELKEGSLCLFEVKTLKTRKLAIIVHVHHQAAAARSSRYTEDEIKTEDISSSNS
ncbi:B3 domain-containing protein [Rhynchospora pubera]|uniref:B3 domain-containing protein n=1 Tax=Rhynchospora pubera TaxID=906938 RepID=A0AAV8FB69_9POAL|nr:B3 domain-containing protein [Rhynchospora pubera]